MKTALISIQSLLASPEPKDPQDAQVARQMMTDPKAFDLEARRWAVKYAGSPASLLGNQNGGSSANALGDSGVLVEVDPNEGYGGYSRALVDRFVQMGFDRDRVVEAFDHFGIDRNGGNDYELEEERTEDITSRLLGDT
jgi:ubiquitin-conjugating enzyme (huntingtin interacting protein 2)